MERQMSKEKYFELGSVPIGIGAVLNGWQGGLASVLDFRAMTEACPHNCANCFTNKNKKTLTLEEIKGVIDQAAEFGFKGINFLGEGEPTWDKDFFEIIEHTSHKGIVPIVFTEAAAELRDNEFVRRTYDSGASVCPKMDSLFNSDYQNKVVGDKTGRYFDERNQAVEELIAQSFNQRQLDGTTRLGFDMVITKRNIEEVEQALRWSRDRNIWIVFSTYLHAGRCAQEGFDTSQNPSAEELTKMRETIRRVDAEYGFNHPTHNNFATFYCVEFMQVYGDGRVSPCLNNETIVGNVRTTSLKDLKTRILEQFPCHQVKNLDGNCPYR